MLFGRPGSHRFRELQAPKPRGLIVPALNFEDLFASSSSIAHPGLAARSCPFSAHVGPVTPFDDLPVSSSRPRSCAPTCLPAQRPRPSQACGQHQQQASGWICRPCGPPDGSRSWHQRSAVGGCRSDRSQLGLAAGGPSLWNQPKPSGEVMPAVESVEVRRKCRHGPGGDGANPRVWAKPAQAGIRPRCGPKRVRQPFHHFGETRDLFDMVISLSRWTKGRAPWGNANANRVPARSRKVGRNELCPCGSGQKYKRSCGTN